MDVEIKKNMIAYLLVTSPAWVYLLILLGMQWLEVIKRRKPRDGE